jgi:hypothetical protein
VEDGTRLHPGTAALLRYFEFEHLPPRLRKVSAPFSELAHRAAQEWDLAGPELTAGLRKLLESKDCVVRAALDTAEPVVTELAHDAVTQTLHLNVRVPGGLTTAQTVELVCRDLERQLAQRSAAEQSGGRR